MITYKNIDEVKLVPIELEQYKWDVQKIPKNTGEQTWDQRVQEKGGWYSKCVSKTWPMFILLCRCPDPINWELDLSPVEYHPVLCVPVNHTRDDSSFRGG